MPEFFNLNNQFKKRVKNYRYFYRGMYQEPSNYDVKFEDYKPQSKISQHDKYLKKFMYKEAMMEAITKK